MKRRHGDDSPYDGAAGMTGPRECCMNEVTDPPSAVFTVPLTLLRRWLFAGLTALAGLGLLAEILHHTDRPVVPDSLVELFSLSYEANVPTWYSSAMLLACGLVLAGVARETLQARAPFRHHWAALAVIFVYMSVDELASLHERLNGLAQFDAGVLHFGWVVPAGALVALLGIAYLPFLASLDARTRRRFLVAGALYVGGALLMELPLGLWAYREGDENLTYALIDFVEEVLEMTGATLFLLALVEHRAASMTGPRAAEET